VCFHSQQAVEKYFKALLHEMGLTVPRTHDLENLIDLLLPHDATLAPLRRSLKTLTQFAVEYRYPGISATARQAQTSLTKARRVQDEIYRRLGSAPPRARKRK
jgi:HEPN domain-containing protein